MDNLENVPSVLQEQENNRSRIPRIRSSAYPSYTIEFCSEFTKKFHQNFGTSNYNQREEIAKVLKVSLGHIQTQLSSSSQYGLIDMKVKAGYKPSESFLKVYRPINDEEKREALIDCLLNPDLYKKLLKQFQGSIVPSVSALSTILFRNHNIAEAAAESAAQIFIDNLNALKLLDNENHLLLDREIEDEGNQEKQEKPIKKIETNTISKSLPLAKHSSPLNTSTSTKQTEEFKENTETYPILIPLKNNRVARLVLPMDFRGEDLDKITKFIDALRE